MVQRSKQTRRSGAPAPQKGFPGWSGVFFMRQQLPRNLHIRNL